MAKVLCVLYDDPAGGYPPQLRARRRSAHHALPRRADRADAERARLRAGRARRLRLRASWACASSWRASATSSSSPPTRTARTRSSSASSRTRRSSSPSRSGPPTSPPSGSPRRPKLKLALTAGHRLRPRRPAGRDRRRGDGRRGDLLEQHQRRRARRDDDPRAGAQLHPVYQDVIGGGWNIAECVSRSYDLEGMQVGTVAAGRIGSAVLRRLKPFEVGLHYTDRHRLPEEVERELGVTFHEDAESMVGVCDVVTINAPLHPETENLFDERDARADETRRLPDQHGARQDLRPRRRRARLRERPARRLRGRRLVPPACAARPPVALDAPPRHDAAHVRARASPRRPATRPARARSSSAGSKARRSARST